MKIALAASAVEVAEVMGFNIEVYPGPDIALLSWLYHEKHRRVAHALIVTLVHRRHQYVHVSFSQKLVDLIEGLKDAWVFFGGLPSFCSDTQYFPQL